MKESEALIGEVLAPEDSATDSVVQVVQVEKGKRPPIVLKKLSHKHKQIISMVLQGESRETVAEACGVHPQYVTMILKQPLAKAYISELSSYLDVKLTGMYEESLNAISRGLRARDSKTALAAAKLQMQATGKLLPSKESEQTAEDVVANILNIGGTVVLNK